MPASGPRPANIGWQIAGLCDTGLRRELNEDSMLMVEADLLDKAESGYVFPSIAMLEVRRGARMPLENRPIVEGVQPVTGKLGIVEKEKSQD